MQYQFPSDVHDAGEPAGRTNSWRPLIVLLVVLVVEMLAVAVGFGVYITVAGHDTPVMVQATPDGRASTGQPVYQVYKTWPAEGGLGGGATLIVASESKSQGQAAIVAYFRSVQAAGRYVYVEVLGHPDATEWFCAGELLISSADKRYAIFDESTEYTVFPAQTVKCREM